MRKFFAFTITVFASFCAFAQAPDLPAVKGSAFGEKVTENNAISAEQLQTLMSSKTGNKSNVEVKLKGVVTDVCTMEGCWIKVQSSNGKMMVKMKDHNFTVPVALNGKTVVIDGIAEERVTSVEELKHYAKDAGKTAEEIATINEPKKEIIVHAKGILVI